MEVLDTSDVGTVFNAGTAITTVTTGRVFFSRQMCVPCASECFVKSVRIPRSFVSSAPKLPRLVFYVFEHALSSATRSLYVVDFAQPGLFGIRTVAWYT